MWEKMSEKLKCPVCRKELTKEEFEEIKRKVTERVTELFREIKPMLKRELEKGEGKAGFKIYKRGEYYFAEDVRTGKIKYKGKNASEVIQKAINALPAEKEAS